MWDIELTSNTSTSSNLQPSSHFQHKLQVITNKNTPLSDLIRFYVGIFFSARKFSLLAASKKGHLDGFAGLTPDNINKLYQRTLASAKGHLNQERKNLQTTKSNTPLSPQQEFLLYNDFHPNDEKLTQPTYNTLAMLIDFQATNTGYSDLTGRFPITSSRGNKYILIVYNYDTNSIHAKAVPNRQAATLTSTFINIHNDLTFRGAKPNMYLLDNEFSNELELALQKNNIKYQLAPPHNHRSNKAERAIQTFKEHFIAGINSVNPNFPITEWDRLIEQAEITLNLLRSSRLNPNLSAYSHLYGMFSFNKTPMAPPGTRIILHEKPKQRASWDPHGKEAWYIGPAMKHYRCITGYIPSTMRERISDTVEYFPHDIPFPKFDQADYLRQAALDILSILKSPQPVLKFLPNNNKNEKAIELAAKVLQRATAKTPPIIVPPEPIAQPAIPTSQPQKETLNNATLPRVEEVTEEDEKETPPSTNNNNNNTPAPRVNPQYYQGTNFNELKLFGIFAKSLLTDNKAFHIYNKETGKKETIDTLLSTKDPKWESAISNEFGRLLKGNKNGVGFTDTMEFIHKQQLPSNKKTTYATYRFDHRPLKSEPWRCRMVVGGDKLPYDDDAGSPAASLLETKLIINSVISDSDKGARFFTLDLKDFFLCSTMEDPEYMKVYWKHIPEDIRQRYNLYQFKQDDDDYLYIKIKRGMYGLKQAAILAYKQLIEHLRPHGYRPIPHTTGLWEHTTRKTKFCLCVDDFGVKYFSDDDKNHLISTLKKYYKLSVDESGTKYCGLTIDWNYEKKYVDISMPGYIEALVKKLLHTPPAKPQYSPHTSVEPTYGQKVQYAQEPDTSTKLNAKQTTKVQSIVGSLLYWARAIDCTLLPGLNDVGRTQSSPTEKDLKRSKKLLDYAWTYKDTKVRFHASDMILYVESDAAYLVIPGAKSRIAGYFYLSDKTPSSQKVPQPPLNGPLLILCQALRTVVASIAEAETAGVYNSTQEALPIRYILEKLEHKQPPTPLKMDNSTSLSFIEANIRQRRSKSWDMRYYWLREKETKDQMKFYWEPGAHNNADYFTKHHSIKHHLKERPKFVLNTIIQLLRLTSSWRGCVDVTRDCHVVSPQLAVTRLNLSLLV